MKRSINPLVRAIETARNLDESVLRSLMPWMETISRVKHEIEAKAVEMGYAKWCRDHIPVCQGACCKWHYPKDLNTLDYFLAVYNMGEPRRQALWVRLQPPAPTDRCLVLAETGCFFHFEERPLVCTIAYPCFQSTAFWRFQTEKMKTIDDARQTLKKITGLDLE